MPGSGGESNEVERLKSLLFSAESHRLAEAEGRLDGLEGWVGDAGRLEAATAEILVAAFQRAEVARHRELAAAVEAAGKSIETRPGLLSSQKARWKRSLNDAQSQWIGWRDSECQDVAPFEAGMNARGGDPRLSCIIDQDARRMADLKARYP